MDLEQLTERVYHIAEIHLVSLGVFGANVVGNTDEADQLLVALLRLLAVSAPLLLYAQNQKHAHLAHTAPHKQTLSQAALTGSTAPVPLPSSVYPRFVRMWHVLSRSYVHPWGRRESVRYAALTSYFQTDAAEIVRALEVFKEVLNTLIPLFLSVSISFSLSLCLCLPLCLCLSPSFYLFLSRFLTISLFFFLSIFFSRFLSPTNSSTILLCFALIPAMYAFHLFILLITTLYFSSTSAPFPPPLFHLRSTSALSPLLFLLLSLLK